MSYDPQSGGGTEPTGGGETRPTGGSGDMQPMGGSTGSSGSGGGMEPMGGQPTMPTGGYTPPPAGGGYTPPPPPPPGGGYAPPPPPPPGQGYGPPPTGGPSFNVGNMGTVNQASLSDLFQSYMNAVTKPSAATYEAEIPKASWLRTLIGVAAVAVVSFIINLIFAGAAASTFAPLRQQLEQQGYTGPDPFAVTAGGAVTGALWGLIGTFISFFLGAGLLWLMARMFGGTGSDFMTHSYLLSISYTPLRIISTILAIIPVVGGLVALVAYLYQIYSAGLAMQASQRMQPGRAQIAAFLPTIIGIVLGCLCFFVAIAAVVSIINGAANR